ncbi:MAG: hypothetical protein AB7O28_09960 [Vicinamibacterales bacterium]
MDDVQNRLARELADAIAAAVAQDAGVERCRARAKAAGFHLHLNLEATVGFASVDGQGHAGSGEAVEPAPLPAYEVTANDRRFLRSLRIAADEVNLQENNG